MGTLAGVGAQGVSNDTVAVAALKVGTSHARLVRSLQKVVAGAGDGQPEKVQADTPAAARGDRQGHSRPAGGMWSAFTR